jgi:hypothetical protein
MSESRFVRLIFEGTRTHRGSQDFAY